MLHLVHRPIKVVDIVSNYTDFNLFTATGNIGIITGSINYPHNLYCIINADLFASRAPLNFRNE